MTEGAFATFCPEKMETEGGCVTLTPGQRTPEGWLFQECRRRMEMNFARAANKDSEPLAAAMYAAARLLTAGLTDGA